MQKSLFDQVLNIVLSGSMHVTSVRTGNTIHSTGSLNLDDQDKIQLLQYVMNERGCSPEEAVTILQTHSQSALKKKVSRTIWPWILLIVALFVFSNMLLGDTAVAMPVFGILAVFVVMLRMILTSRTRAMKKAWEKHRRSGDDLQTGIDKITAASEKPLFQRLNVPVFIVMLVLIMGFSGLIVVSNLPEPAYEQVIDWVSIANEDEDIKWIKDALDGLSPEKAEQQMNKAYEHYEKEAPGGEEIVILTHMAYQLADEGIIGMQAASALADKTLAVLNVDDIGTHYESSALVNIISHMDETRANQTLNYILAAEPQADFLCEALGGYCADKKTTAELMEMSRHLNAEAFLKAAFAGDDMAKTQQRMGELTDVNDRRTLAVSMAGNYTLPNDVLAFIRMAKACGLKPTDCYPDGALLDWDLSALDPFAAASEIPACAKYLPVTITEKAEPIEYQSVPSDMYSTEDNFQSMYDDAYEGNAARGKDAFTIHLDTRMLEMMPEQYIPETIEELDSLLAMSTLYVREGTLRNSRYSTHGASEQLEWQRDYPTYSAVQLISLYNMADMTAPHHYAYNIVASPEIPASEMETSSFSFLSLDSSDINKYYSGQPDSEWSINAREEFIQTLTEAEWSPILAALMYMVVE